MQKENKKSEQQLSSQGNRLNQYREDFACQDPAQSVNFQAKLFFESLNMTENPFAGTPDPKYLYESSTHAEAKSSLIIGLECGVGFQALIAPPGMGKTTILFDVIKQFQPIARTAFLFQPRGDYRDVLRYLLSELGERAGPDLLDIQERVNRLLVREHEAGRRTIVVVDEAQSLNSEALETLRLLSNFETPSEKLLQIVLAGQPQLAKNLADPGLRQLQQRISILKTLAPLDLRETDNYIQHRLWVGGYEGEPLFTSAAIKLIWEASYGVPREINTLCFNAILLVTALKRKHIDEEILREVIADTTPIESIDVSATSRPERVKLPAKQGSAQTSDVAMSSEEQRPERLSAQHIHFYNFKMNPFDRVPDPSRLCLTSTHWRALAGLYTRIVQKGGVLLLVGDPGSGKSLVVSCVMKLLSSNDLKVEYVGGGQLSATRLFEISHSGAIGFDSAFPRAPALCPALFVDDAETLSRNSWQQLQDLIENKNGSEQWPTIVIVGRSEIEDVLASAELETLNRAVAVCYRLHDLGETEIKNYISCRLRLVQKDSDAAPVFSEDAISALSFHSHGNPGAINCLCEAALVKACAKGNPQISADLIDQVAHEVQPNPTCDERAPRHHPACNAELVKAAGVLLDLHLALHT